MEEGVKSQVWEMLLIFLTNHFPGWEPKIPKERWPVLGWGCCQPVAGSREQPVRVICFPSGTLGSGFLCRVPSAGRTLAFSLGAGHLHGPTALSPPWWLSQVFPSRTCPARSVLGPSWRIFSGISHSVLRLVLLPISFAKSWISQIQGCLPW